MGISNKLEASRPASTEDSFRLLNYTAPAFIHTALPEGGIHGGSYCTLVCR